MVKLDQENRIEIAAILRNKSAMIGPNATVSGLRRVYVIPQATIDTKASETPPDLPCRKLFFNSAKFEETKKNSNKNSDYPGDL